MAIIQSVFASSEGLNCSTDTCSALQRSLSLRTGVPAASRPLPRALCSTPSCSPFRPQTQIPHMPACQLSNHCSDHSAACFYKDNSLTGPLPQHHRSISHKSPNTAGSLCLWWISIWNSVRAYFLLYARWQTSSLKVCVLCQVLLC